MSEYYESMRRHHPQYARESPVEQETPATITVTEGKRWKRSVVIWVKRPRILITTLCDELETLCTSIFSIHFISPLYMPPTCTNISVVL